MLVEGHPIVIAGMACRYPDADDPATLLLNSLECRQSFRVIPPERLDLSAYAANLVGEPDSITKVPAGLLTNWTFDTGPFRVPKPTYEGADLAHWLALEVAAEVLENAGGADRLDTDRTVVVVANTLTGEFSRANALRLRLPWLDQQLASVLDHVELSSERSAVIRGAFRDRVCSMLREPDEESLAGGLANTIAGRIANHFDFHGGAFSIDAACASSLVAIADAAEMVANGRAHAALVVAVDLSLDPFELVGFSRNGALAQHRMRVFDERAEGFWPGEGAAGLLLLSVDEAKRLNISPTVDLLGWGISTDGRGGLTRPDEAGQRRAIERAYDGAGVDPRDVHFVEAHGTGTAIGDPVEVRALASTLGKGRSQPLPIASVKGNIGHTKAAAGLAGLIRAASAMAEGVVPPHTGCEKPHQVFADTDNRIKVSFSPEEWPRCRRRIAGVSSFGFGGINAHIVLGSDGHASKPAPRSAPTRDEALFLFKAPDRHALRGQIEALVARASSLSYAEVGDAAAKCAVDLGRGPYRLSFRAGTPEDVELRLADALSALDGKVSANIHFGQSCTPPRVGLVFPGQAAPVRFDGGAWGRLFPGMYPQRPSNPGPVGTQAAQPAIAQASLAAVDLLEKLGIAAEAAVGHSLGELVALTWAGAFPCKSLVDLAKARGEAMARVVPGAMLQLACDGRRAVEIASGLDLVVACFNAENETVMSGSFEAIEALQQRAAQARIESVRLNVSHAFHAPEMAAAAEPLLHATRNLKLESLHRRVASTVTGSWLDPEVDVRDLLIRQLTQPVRFSEALRAIASETDVLVEAGPGAGLSRLVALTGMPVVSVDAFGPSLAPMLDALGSLFVAGLDFNPAPLFQGPGIRSLAPSAPTFLASPCRPGGGSFGHIALEQTSLRDSPLPPTVGMPVQTLTLLMRLVSEATGLSEDLIKPDLRFLDDLHLNSLAVGRILSRLAADLGRRPLGPQTALANARLNEAAEAFDEASVSSAKEDITTRVAGVAPWVRRFRPATTPLEPAPRRSLRWHTLTLDQDVLGEGDGVVIDLYEGWDFERDAWRLLHLCQRAVGRFRHLAMSHRGAPLVGFARSIAAEGLFESVRLIDGRAAPELLARQVLGFEEIIQERDGSLATSILAVAEADSDMPISAIAGSVLVTGGARGIASECAIRLAERHGVPLILVGRAPRDNTDVVATLDRVAALGAPVRYVSADVEDAEGMQAGVAAAAAEIGPVSILIHAAGTNRPAQFDSIDEELLRQTGSPKTAGLNAAISACGKTLSRIVTFGSIIARMGLAGEAHYALANAEQTRLLAQLAGERGLSALAIEWSVWGGVGMGERLGAIERLGATGVDALSLDQALDEFEALALGSIEGAVVVSSRFGLTAAPELDEPLRFVDHTLVHTPGVELVVETQVGIGRDPYVADHRVDAGLIFPGVMSMEAMAQAARALTNTPLPAIERLNFDSAIHFENADVGLCIAVLADKDSVRTELRQDPDSFSSPVAAARFRRAANVAPPAISAVESDIDAQPLYGPLYFQGTCFRRLRRLGAVSSRSLHAWFEPAEARHWFGKFEPQTLVLGDPGVRDACLHALQACVPHRRVIPVSATAVEFYAGNAPVRLHATERWQDSDQYAFDVMLVDGHDRVVEYWQEAVFQAVGPINIAAVLETEPGLRRAFIERWAREAIGNDTIAVELIDDPTADRAQRRERAANSLGLSGIIARRGDGKPLSPHGRCLSFAHHGSVTLAISSEVPIGCDIEALDGFDRADQALVWTAEEALRKLGSRAPVTRCEPGIFTGAARERIAAFAPVSSPSCGMMAVAVGTAAQS